MSTAVLDPFTDPRRTAARAEPTPVVVPEDPWAGAIARYIEAGAGEEQLVELRTFFDSLDPASDHAAAILRTIAESSDDELRSALSGDPEEEQTTEEDVAETTEQEVETFDVAGATIADVEQAIADGKISKEEALAQEQARGDKARVSLVEKLS